MTIQIINQYAGDDLIPIFIIGFILECILSAQKLLFHSHFYANVYKVFSHFLLLL